ncbi:YcaO-like family protein [Actinocorallia libanotica]|uniref:YcaO domain-containing protein n=1 Tax=Actinocorallia libanotica TaxID=46162 RepID=A0ABN1RH93_9ACTN
MIGADERCGIVTRIGHGRSHGVLHTATADLAATDAYALPLGNSVVGGTSWHSPDRAARRALGEAVERYAGHLVDPARLRWATAEELGEQALDLGALALYRGDQHARRGFPFRGLRPGTELAWVEGRTSDGRASWVPASLVWLAPGRHAEERTGAGRATPHLPVAAGIAAGDSPGRARAAALAEVVERHALATAWYSGDRFPELPPQPVPLPHGAELTWRAVPNLLAAPVVACIARSGDRITLGCALVPDAADPVAAAGRKAAAEALVSLDALDAVIEGMPDWSAVLKPVRADRRYADSYRPDLADATDLVCTLQLLADPRVARSVAARLAGGAPRGAWRPEPLALGPRLREHGLAPVTVDLTPPGLAASGWSVARVLVPGLRSVGPAAFPYLGDGAEALPREPERLPLPHV